MKKEIVTIKVYKETRESLNILSGNMRKQQVDVSFEIVDKALMDFNKKMAKKFIKQSTKK